MLTDAPDTITWRDHLEIVRLRYRTVLAVAAAAILGAVAVAASITPSFEGRASVTLALDVSDQSRFVNTQEEYVQALVRGCIALAATPVVLDAAIGATGAAVTSDELADALEVRARTDSLVIEVRVLDPSPTGAAALAVAVADRMVVACDALRPSGPTEGRIFRFEVTSRGAVPERDVSPRWRLTLGTAGVLGLLAGVVVALALDAARPRIGSPGRPGGEFRAPVLGRIEGRPTSRRRRRSVASLTLRVDAARRARSARTILLTSAEPCRPVGVTISELGPALADLGRRVRTVEHDGPVDPVEPAEGPDVVLVLGPPASGSARCLELAAQVDAVIVEVGPRTAAARAADAVETLQRSGAEVLGVVVTDRG